MEPLHDGPSGGTPPGGSPFGGEPPERLLLRIVAAPPGQVPPKLELPLIVKDDGPITVGRLDDNDLVLPDDNLHVSRCHCWLDEQDGVWLLQNRSAKNGAWVNDKLLAEGEVATLAAGDVVRIVGYTLRLEADASPAAPEGDPGPAVQPDTGAVDESSFPQAPESREQARIVENEVAPTPTALPPHCGEAPAETGRPGHDARPPGKPAPGPREDLLAAFLAGAGLERLPDGVDPAAAMRALGESSRLLLRTLAQLLAARRALQSDFLVPPTVIASSTNNASRFPVEEGQMLGLLLGAAAPGFTSGPGAIAATCRDLVEHQVALLAGIQAALTLVVQRLSPEQISASTKGGLLGGKAKQWERYEAVYDQVQRDVANNLAGPLGQAFAAAYEAYAKRGN